ncbi:hypothetical protein GGR77_001104 [Xanthomonas translucens]
MAQMLTFPQLEFLAVNIMQRLWVAKARAWRKDTTDRQVNGSANGNGPLCR